ncbi:hypothetical protein E1A34_26690 [Salmonella enterica subsp. enterica serovar Newport]|uniref:Uncharacterized protein n=1 Tax=Salmonella newport TaxID=108619 RepID=A0A5Y0S627_SALNE|nr:hypothetical protein [Salmonella enterica subsp. enterica serovar Newport]EBS4408638.1 hypothetical protein [Salmonella enterica subsp. enterica serovar Newport]ECB7109578.1 hypothetical protein [Salmonella enterica subsp. enterica serovar Newport]ECF2112310.1 hypothetical protein [Salmonella enterica subsp. enterica serovar Newport]ECJ3621507.1 hypothetical protein [Salmonella enterica subsp. enterica serovar Newport]
MTNFKPLDGFSQAHADDVFYFDANASDEALIDNATNRIYNLMSLHSDIAGLHKDNQIDASYLSAVSTYLLSDAYSLLTELSDRQMKNQGNSDKTLIDQQAKAIIALTEIIGKNARAKDEQERDHE